MFLSNFQKNPLGTKVVDSIQLENVGQYGGYAYCKCQKGYVHGFDQPGVSENKEAAWKSDIRDGSPYFLLMTITIRNSSNSCISAAKYQVWWEH